MCLSIQKEGLTSLSKQYGNREIDLQECHSWFHMKVGYLHGGWGSEVSLSNIMTARSSRFFLRLTASV